MHKLKTTISYEYAHRLYDVATYSEECRNNIHGHSGYLTVVVGRKTLNEAGMVIDFKLLKKILKECIEDVYDHSCILKSTDPISGTIVNNCNKVHIVSENPTAEWMAKHFYEAIQSELNKVDPHVVVTSVEVQETDRNIAIYELEDPIDKSDR